MNFFDNFKVGTKISSGFIIILILMGIIGGMAIFQFSQIKSTVTNLADNFAKDQYLAEQLVTQILLTRFYANKYIRDHKVEDLDRFNEEFANFEKLLVEADIEITKGERVKMLAEIKAGVEKYGKNFSQVTKFVDKRHDTLSKILDIQGPLAEQKLEQLRDSAFKADDAIASFYAGNAQRALLLMRLDAFKYLDKGDIKWVKKFNERYQEAQSAFKQLDKELQDPTRQQLAESAKEIINKYHQGFISLQADYKKQNQIIETQLNVIGPQVRKTASKMSDSVTVDFDATNQKTRTLVDNTRWQLSITMFVAILIGIILGWFIAQSITVPLATVIEMSNKMSNGIMAQDIQNLTKVNSIINRQDEIGNIGRAYDTLADYFKMIIEDIVQVSQNLANGNLQAMPADKYKGDFVKIKDSMETALFSLSLVIKDIVQVSQGLADGDLRTTTKAEYKGDFVQIKDSMEIALSSLNKVVKDTVQVSQGLADGNLRVIPKAEYKGDFIKIKNALETVLLAQSQVIEDIVQVSQGLADGSKNVVAKAEYLGDFMQIKTALETAANKLSEAMAQNTIQDWLKTGQTELSKKISGELEIIDLAKNICDFLTTYLEAQVGAFYIVEEETQIKLIASYAYEQRKGLPNEFQLGEGLVGQAVLEKQKILVTDVPENYISIQSGIGEAVPRNILVMPFMYENSVKGAIEIGSFHEFTSTQLELLEQVMPNIGITMNTAESRTKMQALLQSES
ncbi:GAF domain-containing protein [Candidatus Halobeggiatoa sp. HSG11]|nr:GAF domain-containing protein [Candidatus Halobeggiatoa sp. HSG11]